MNEFGNALLSEKPNEEYKDKLMLFGQFVGEWDFEWIDGKGTANERHVKGEWLFSWILEGKVIQDIFIYPSRSERLKNYQPDAEYGTTIRFYNPEQDIWEICYGYLGNLCHLQARQVNEQIIITNLDTSNGLNEWVFSDITEDTFHWQNRSSFDEGKTWIVNGELFAERRK